MSVFLGCSLNSTPPYPQEQQFDNVISLAKQIPTITYFLNSSYPLNNTLSCLPDPNCDSSTLLAKQTTPAASSKLSYLLDKISPNLRRSNWDSVMRFVKKIPEAAILIPATTAHFVMASVLPAICFPDFVFFSEFGRESKSALSVQSIAPIQILEEQTFKSANVGAIALFAHQNRFVHLGIALGQYVLKLPQIGINITHAGIVAEKPHDTAISLYEIPGPGFPISKMNYLLNDLKSNAQLLFFDPHLLLPEQERDVFIKHLLEISKIFIDNAGKSAEHRSDYNLAGIARLPIESATFLESDWITLLDDLVEYYLLTEGGKNSYSPKKTKYFCSEFVFKKIHLARLMQKHPEICEQIQAALKTHDLTDLVQRKEFTERLYQESVENGKFGDLLKDPLFFMPSRSIMPAHLIQFAEIHHLPLYRVENPDSESENELEVSVSRWLYESATNRRRAIGTTYRTALFNLWQSFLPV